MNMAQKMKSDSTEVFHRVLPEVEETMKGTDASNSYYYI
jgi:hypothetical protein